MGHESRRSRSPPPRGGDDARRHNRSHRERSRSRSRSPKRQRRSAATGHEDGGHRQPRERARARAVEYFDDGKANAAGGRRRDGIDKDRGHRRGEEHRQQQDHASRHHHHHRHQDKGDRGAKAEEAKDEGGGGSGKPLPFGARILSRRHDFDAFADLFGYYLDLHKSLDINKLPEDEIRGRWKSFAGKWNRGELAEGWYDPEMFERVSKGGGGGGMDREKESGEEGGGGGDEGGGRDTDEFGRVRRERERSVAGVDDGGRTEPTRERSGSIESNHHSPALNSREDDEDDEDDDDNYGPSLPPTSRDPQNRNRHRHGAEAPTLQDLTLRTEAELETRESELASLRHARKADRRQQKEALDELLPRADAGTRERKLEKRQLVNEKMRAFREPSPTAEVPEADLMGDGEDGGLAGHKRRLATQQMKVSERQLRREEIERAKAAEREGRIREFREKEERTVATLRELARRRFGGGGGGAV